MCIRDRHPTILAFHLVDDFLDDRNRVRWLLEGLSVRSGLRLIRWRAGQEVLRVDKPPTGLSKALWGLLLAEPEDVDALLSNARGEPGEIAVG